MPEMTGVEFLAELAALPEAVRVLLTAFADTERGHPRHQPGRR